MKSFKNIINRIKSNEKNKSIATNIIYAFIIKGFSLTISVFSMPLYISYFNDNTYLGLWFTMLSLLIWVFTFDLGLGNGLRNHLVKYLVNKDNQKSRQLISSAYMILGSISICGIFISIFTFPLINWNTFFSIDDSLINRETLTLSVTILFVGVMISFTLKIINSILYALQKSSLNNLISLISNIIPVTYLYLYHPQDLNDKLIDLSIIYTLALCLPLFIATILVFKRRDMRQCSPLIKDASYEYAKSIIKLGGLFFIVQIMFMILTSTNEILISHFFKLGDVVDYQIYYRLFTFVGSIFMLALTPLWSSVTKAIAEKDYKWIIKINRALYLVALGAALFEFGLIIFLQQIINVWLGSNSITVNYYYALIFATYGSFFIFNVVVATIANGIGYLKTQLIIYTAGAFFKIPFIYWVSKITDNWSMVVLSNILVLSVFCIVQASWTKKNLTKFLNSHKSDDLNFEKENIGI